MRVTWRPYTRKKRSGRCGGRGRDVVVEVGSDDKLCHWPPNVRTVGATFRTGSQARKERACFGGFFLARGPDRMALLSPPPSTTTDAFKHAFLLSAARTAPS